MTLHPITVFLLETGLIAVVALLVIALAASLYAIIRGADSGF